MFSDVLFIAIDHGSHPDGIESKSATGALGLIVTTCEICLNMFRLSLPESR